MIQTTIQSIATSIATSIAIGLLSIGFIYAQDNPVTFTFQNQILTTNNHSGVVMVVVDMNGDGKDDIVRYDKAKELKIEYQTEPNEMFDHHYVGATSTNKQWSNCIADIDKNGFNDIFTGGYYDDPRFIMNGGPNNFNQIIPSNTDIFLQGSNFVDIDNDGWVDLFACHDEGENIKMSNNQDGTFTIAPDLLDTTTDPVSDNSGNYASIWTDYDNDQDLDLYISKCRGGVSSSSDPRRINMLFQNDGNNNFTEVAEEAGLKIGAQTWVSDFADIDNDGDMDAFIGNHTSESQLMENNGDGTFTDITVGSGLLPSASTSNMVVVQSIFRDFNNDGYLDLLLSGTDHYIFYNNGDKTFTVGPNPFGSNDVESFAIGDLNHDGFLDVYTGYSSLYNTPSFSSTKYDRLYFNDGNENNFIAIQLEGTLSNINGIGARVELHGSWGKQIREVRSGEGYGIMNSFTQHFGIGQADEIEKVVVSWPSGVYQEIYNPEPNQFLKIVEENLFCNLDLPEKALQRQGALFGISDFPLDGNEIYSWYDATNTLVAQFIGNPYFSPEEIGSYSLIVTDPDFPNCEQTFDFYSIDRLDGCCELND